MAWLGLAWLGLAWSSQAFAGDWTPLLKSMKNGCAMHDITTGNNALNIPANLKKDIVSNKRSGEHSTITLKNATAFGKSITKIQAKLPDTSELSSVKVYFADGNFTNIRSQFSVELGDKKYPANKYGIWSLNDSYVATAINEAKFKQLQQHAKAHDGDYGSGVVSVLQINQKGWRLGTVDEMDGGTRTTSLTFDSTNKTIECVF
ncbi:hypothetical protein [Moraxella oblonga]|uniref:hypothetical protein n=1 Tax=Moraxella oblonga TaxID=200413 RepID=UPI000B2FE4BC|nr:hypothetical protein [Moraxella oblonga]